jgi:hypothetical protein
MNKILSWRLNSLLYPYPWRWTSMGWHGKQGGRRQHQGLMQNTNGMSMICALGQGLVIFVQTDATMILWELISHIQLVIGETKAEGFTMVHGLILSFIHRQKGIRIRRVSESMDPCQTPWCFPTMDSESRHCSINLPDDIRTVQLVCPVSRLERNTAVLVEIRVQWCSACLAFINRKSSQCPLRVIDWLVDWYWPWASFYRVRIPW